MTSEKLLHQVLDIEAPWQIVRVRDDLGKRQVDVWVGRPTGRTGWFFGNKASVPEDRERVWRHINLGSSRCLVHAAPPAEHDSGRLTWCGDGDLPFTRALSRQIAGLFREGVKFQSICAMLDIAVADLWKFKHSLDHGKAGLSEAASLQLPAESVDDGSAVPSAEHPIWQHLLEGTVNIDIRVLSLKLLLTKQREQMRLITDNEVRMLKAHEMRRYFVRYEQQLGHELAQLAKL